MYIKRDAWKKAASTTMQMNILMLEWGAANLIGHKSRKLNLKVRSRMESVSKQINWPYIGVGLTKCIRQPKEP